MKNGISIVAKAAWQVYLAHIVMHEGLNMYDSQCTWFMCGENIGR